LAFLANGESIHTKRWLTYFVSKGYDVHLITFTPEPIKGVKIHRLRYFRKFAYPLRIWNIRRAIKKVNPDILHAHYLSHYGVYGALAGFHPYIVSVWGSDIIGCHHIKKLLLRFVLKKADVIDGFGLRKQLIDLGCNPNKIIPRSWGVDTDVFSPKARSDDLRIIYSVVCARFWEPQYSVETFVRAIPLILRTVKNVKFIMLGGGTLENKLKELARKLGVYDNIVWVGRIPEEDMPKYLADADIYVDTFPRHAGIGQTTKQAMSCGTPCIITESVDDVVNITTELQCLLYKQRDCQDLAEKILLLLGDEKIRKLMGSESRKLVLKFFDMKKNMKVWENVYMSYVRR
jgi:glycosyltransferase involved in cell wall biosynthesis